MLQLLHRLKVKRVGLNPTGKTGGGNSVWKVLIEEHMFKRL